MGISAAPAASQLCPGHTPMPPSKNQPGDPSPPSLGLQVWRVPPGFKSPDELRNASLRSASLLKGRNRKGGLFNSLGKVNKISL